MAISCHQRFFSYRNHLFVAFLLQFKLFQTNKKTILIPKKIQKQK